MSKRTENGYGNAKFERPTPSNAHLGPENAPNSPTPSPGCGQQPPRPSVRLSTAVVWSASLAGVPHLAEVATVTSRVYSYHTYCLTPTFDMHFCNLYYKNGNKNQNPVIYTGLILNPSRGRGSSERTGRWLLHLQ